MISTEIIKDLKGLKDDLYYSFAHTYINYPNSACQMLSDATKITCDFHFHEFVITKRDNEQVLSQADEHVIRRQEIPAWIVYKSYCCKDNKSYVQTNINDFLSFLQTCLFYS